MENALTKFRNLYPEMNSDWEHKIPYYLVKVGAFKEKLDYQGFLIEIKKDFPGAIPIAAEIREEELLGSWSMSSIRNRSQANFDWISFSLYVSLVVIGALMLYATDHTAQQADYLAFSESFKRQLIWVGISSVSYTHLTLPTKRIV